MIPLVLPPLYGLGVLVTRPAHQADSLMQRLTELGARSRHWPTLQIEALPVDMTVDGPCDMLIFVSANAVMHGAALLQRYPQARLAAVGSATARELEQRGFTLDVTPGDACNSEALLNHPLLTQPPAHITIVRGRGGRELLQDTLTERGAQVTAMEVYARQPVQAQASDMAQLQQEWLDDDIQVVTATSVDVLQGLKTMLPAALYEQLCNAALLCGSPRIAQAARATGWRGELVVATSPEERELIDALTRWHTRQRT